MKSIYLLFIGMLLFSCKPTAEPTYPQTVRDQLSAFLKTIENKDIDGMNAFMPTDGKLEFILPDQQSYTAKEFIDFHSGWFQDTSTTWSMPHTIKDLKVNGPLATATVHGRYQEPLRDGKPYYNVMAITYVLENQNGKWVITKDHACSIEKSTDPK